MVHLLLMLAMQRSSLLCLDLETSLLVESGFGSVQLLPLLISVVPAAVVLPPALMWLVGTRTVAFVRISCSADPNYAPLWGVRGSDT